MQKLLKMQGNTIKKHVNKERIRKAFPAFGSAPFAVYFCLPLMGAEAIKAEAHKSRKPFSLCSPSVPCDAAFR